MFFKKAIKKIILNIYSILFHILTTKNNIILFESSTGRNYSGNPKYIYEYLLKNEKIKYGNKFKYVWSLEDTSIDIKGNPIKVRKKGFKYFYYSIVAKFWIFDSRHPQYLLKKDKCIYIQTWHGTPLKKLGLDMEYINMSGETNIEKYKANFKRNSEKWDYLISQNRFSSKIFKRAFNFNGKTLEIGYPRNDILINKKEDMNFIKEIKNKLNIPDGKKIILYAPTWRDNQFYKKGIYKFASEMDFELMEKELSNDYIILVKYHYLVNENSDWNKNPDFVKILDEKAEIQELYLITDILITDYSSVMFDYSLLEKPMIFYLYDLEFYKNNLRDFYFDIYKELPGHIIENNKELLAILKKFKEKNYLEKHSNLFKEKYKNFKEKYNQYDDANSSKKIHDLIITNINKNK